MSDQPKINKTCRVRLPLTTIYCSSHIHTRVKGLCIRVHNNVMVPLKGKSPELEETLRQLSEQFPHDFTNSGISFLQRYSRPRWR